GALAAGVAEKGEGLVEELAGEDAVGVLLDDEVEGVLLEAGSDASGVAGLLMLQRKSAWSIIVVGSPSHRVKP
ncbi:hypothetical protein, partial [Archangium sp.]|uniref:hypothetical protein n=1 Tax=Archangium sp. TaxID=1872627 RepID=UPI002D4C3E1D